MPDLLTPSVRYQRQEMEMSRGAFKKAPGEKSECPSACALLQDRSTENYPLAEVLLPTS